MSNYKLNVFKLDDGSRICLLSDKEGRPLLYPNLYLEDEIRRVGKTATTNLTVAKIIRLLLSHLDQQGVSLVDSIINKRFLNRDQIKSIIDFMSIKRCDGNVVNIRGADKVSSGTRFYRVVVAFKYMTWLCKYILGDKTYTDSNAENFIRMLQGYKPKKKIDEDFYNKRVRALDDYQKKALFSYVSMNSNKNIYSLRVRKRNELIIILLYSLGLRKGELLNIRVGDIKFKDNIISIIRRHDDKYDSRVKQPLVKTLERDLKVSDWIINKIHNYITTDRREYIGKKQHDYLLISHKGCDLSGEPMSIDGYEKTIQKIRESDQILENFSGHALRHTWNNEFSLKLENSDSDLKLINPELIRCYAMGWSPASQMAATYDIKNIRKRMFQILAKVQASIYADVEGLING